MMQVGHKAASLQIPRAQAAGSAAAPDPQREDVAQLAAASGTSGTASVTACSSPSLASPCRRDGKTFRIAWREGAPEEKAAVPGQEAEPPAPAPAPTPSPAPLPAWLDASVGFASFPRRSLHREIEEKPRYPVFCSELEPEALSIGLGSLGTLPEATQGPPLAQSALSPSAAAAPPLAAATMFATTTTAPACALSAAPSAAPMAFSTPASSMTALDARLEDVPKLLEMELGKRLRALYSVSVGSCFLFFPPRETHPVSSFPTAHRL